MANQGEKTPDIYKQDPYKVMEDIVDRWIAADEAEKAEREAELRAQGLPANELELHRPVPPGGNLYRAGPQRRETRRHADSTRHQIRVRD